MILSSGNIPVEVRNELDVMAIAKIIFPVDNPPGSGGVRFATKKEAIEQGRRISQNQETELIIHNKNGRFSEADSHGNDPYPPRG